MYGFRGVDELVHLTAGEARLLAERLTGAADLVDPIPADEVTEMHEAIERLRVLFARRDSRAERTSHAHMPAEPTA